MSGATYFRLSGRIQDIKTRPTSTLQCESLSKPADNLPQHTASNKTSLDMSGTHVIDMVHSNRASLDMLQQSDKPGPALETISAASPVTRKGSVETNRFPSSAWLLASQSFSRRAGSFFDGKAAHPPTYHIQQHWLLI